MNPIDHFITAFYDRYDRFDYVFEEDQKLPSREVLEEVAQILLNVSCLREENRFPSFRVCFIAPDSELLDVYIYSHVLLFDRPIPFSEFELHKLAPALNRHMSYLVLDVRKRPIRIIGIIAAYTDWQKIITREIVTGNQMPRVPNLAVVGPGRLEACFGETPIVSYNSGSCVYYRTDIFTSSCIADALRTDSGVMEHERLGVLYRIIIHMKNLGHGGQLFIVPSLKASEPYVEIKYRLPCRFLFQNDNTETVLPGRSFEKEMVAYADLIAKFTSVDGAVVLTKDFDLLGFGGEMDMSGRKTPQMCFLDHKDRPDPSKHFDDNGMRHRSGYRFCDRVEGGVAVIVSQDGIVKACTKHRDKVVVYDHVSLPLL